MRHYLQKFIRAIIMMTLVSGPLYAQSLFACSMMDLVMDECCCDAHKSTKEAVASDLASSEALSENLCCEQYVEVRLDEDARQDTRFTKPLEIRTDSDPLDLIVQSYDLVAVEKRTTPAVFQPIPLTCYSGSKTYLTTQRLRI